MITKYHGITIEREPHGIGQVAGWFVVYSDVEEWFQTKAEALARVEELGN